MLELKLRTRHN